jgi:hypothetical protein
LVWRRVRRLGGSGATRDVAIAFAIGRLGPTAGRGDQEKAGGDRRNETIVAPSELHSASQVELPFTVQYGGSDVWSAVEPPFRLASHYCQR